MWTCSECGELIEDQFDSCWKCAAQSSDAPLPLEALPLTWRDYGAGLFVSYLVPWAAVFLQMIFAWQSWGDYPFQFRRLLNLGDLTILLWMSVPAAITFLLLLPFLPLPVGRRIAAVCICLAWMCFEAAIHVHSHYIFLPNEI